MIPRQGRVPHAHLTATAGSRAWVSGTLVCSGPERTGRFTPPPSRAVQPRTRPQSPKCCRMAKSTGGALQKSRRTHLSTDHLITLCSCAAKLALWPALNSRRRGEALRPPSRSMDGCLHGLAVDCRPSGGVLLPRQSTAAPPRRCVSAVISKRACSLGTLAASPSPPTSPFVRRWRGGGGARGRRASPGARRAEGTETWLPPCAGSLFRRDRRPRQPRGDLQTGRCRRADPTSATPAYVRAHRAAADLSAELHESAGPSVLT